MCYKDIQVSKYEIMDLASRKLSFIQKFLKLQNAEVLQALEEILENNKVQDYKEKLNQEIDQSMEDAKNDKLTKASDIKAKYGR